MKTITFNPNIENYLPVLQFGLGALVFLGVSLSISALLRPNKPTPSKLEVYECGEDTVGSSQAGFQIRYLWIAMIFLLFEVDVLLLYPYLTMDFSKGFPWSVAAQLLSFICLLILGLWYPWAKGQLSWEKPEIIHQSDPGLVPESVYERRKKELSRLNQKPVSEGV